MFHEIPQTTISTEGSLLIKISLLIYWVLFLSRNIDSDATYEQHKYYSKAHVKRRENGQLVSHNNIRKHNDKVHFGHEYADINLFFHKKKVGNCVYESN